MSLLANGTYVNEKKHHIAIDIVSNDASTGTIKIKYRTSYEPIGELNIDGTGNFDYLLKNGSNPTNFAIAFNTWFRPSNGSYNFRDVWNGVHNPDGSLKMMGVRFYQNTEGAEAITSLGEHVFRRQ